MKLRTQAIVCGHSTVICSNVDMQKHAVSLHWTILYPMIQGGKNREADKNLPDIGSRDWPTKTKFFFVINFPKFILTRGGGLACGLR
jgi:hypothetical protein